MARTSAKAKKQAVNTNAKTEKLKETANKIKEEESGSNTKQDAGDSTDKENDDVNYEVDKIVHTRFYRGKRQYLVRWKGYSEDSDTWENESVVQSCQEALDAFNSENTALVDKSKNDSDNDGDDEETQESTKEETKGKKSVSKNKPTFSKTLKLKKAKTDSENESDGEERKKENKKGKKNESKATKKDKRRSRNDIEEPTMKKAKINEESDVSVSDGKDQTDENEENDKVEEEEKGKKKQSKANKKDKRKKGKETDEVSKKKAKSNKESDDESVTDGKNYEVEKILEVHTKRDGSREFLIRWKGYRPNEDTWEPEAHLDCQDMIDRFMEKVEMAKNIPTRELRESRTVNKFVPYNKSFRSNLRNTGKRPNYQENYQD